MIGDDRYRFSLLLYRGLEEPTPLYNILRMGSSSILYLNILYYSMESNFIKIDIPFHQNSICEGECLSYIIYSVGAACCVPAYPKV